VSRFIYNNAECHYVECRYAECRGAHKLLDLAENDKLVKVPAYFVELQEIRKKRLTALTQRHDRTKPFST
jgi:hypothetical protein